MFRMAVGHSEELDADAAVHTVVDQCVASLDGDEPKAGLLFSTYDTDPEAVGAAVMEAFPGIELAGSTSAGEISSVLGYHEDSVTLAVFASDTVDMTAGIGTGLSGDPVTAARRAVEQARSKTNKEPRLCVIMPSIGGYDHVPLFSDLRKALGEGVAILGGGAAPRSNLEATITAKQFFNGEVSMDSLPLLLFSGPLTYSFGVGTGGSRSGREDRSPG